MHLPYLTNPATLHLLRSVQIGAPTETNALADAPWRVFGTDGVVEIHDPRRADLHRLPPGTPVRLVVDRIGARRRLRRATRRAGIVVERELVVVPSTAHPVVLLDDHPDAVRAFWQSVLAPPGLARAWLPATLAIRVGRRLPWTWTGAVAPGRVVLGRKQ